jgi:hypothetical protein
VAGIVFAVLFTIGVVLIRLSVPDKLDESNAEADEILGASETE